jgi:hypothetical protein
MTSPPMFLDDVVRAICARDDVDVYVKLYSVRAAAQLHRSRGQEGASYEGDFSESNRTIAEWLSCSPAQAKRTIERASALGLVRVRRRPNPLPPKVSLCLEASITEAVKRIQQARNRPAQIEPVQREPVSKEPLAALSEPVPAHTELEVVPPEPHFTHTQNAKDAKEGTSDLPDLSADRTISKRDGGYALSGDAGSASGPLQLDRGTGRLEFVNGAGDALRRTLLADFPDIDLGELLDKSAPRCLQVPAASWPAVLRYKARYIADDRRSKSSSASGGRTPLWKRGL